MSSGWFSTELYLNITGSASLLTLESDVGQATSVFVMQLKISSSSGVCVGCRACLCSYLQCAAEPSSKSPFDTFITITYMVDWFTAYKCCYRGEAFGFCIWLCKNYLHNQVFWSDFPRSEKMNTRRILLLLPLSVWVNKNVKKSASVGQTQEWNVLVKAICLINSM